MLKNLWKLFIYKLIESNLEKQKKLQIYINECLKEIDLRFRMSETFNKDRVRFLSKEIKESEIKAKKLEEKKKKLFTYSCV
jgi:hypothetical protein